MCMYVTKGTFSPYLLFISLFQVTLEESFLSSVLPLLTKRMTIRNGFEALSCLVLVFKTQEAVSVLPKRYVRLVPMPSSQTQFQPNSEFLIKSSCLYWFWA